MPGFAWVTLATNDSYSLGALVLAHSLKISNTAHELVVLITPGVSQSMRDKLNAVFNIVREVNVLDSKDATHLALLARPELGITFTKLHAWNLTEYQKCVFLDADTLVLQNCDELFEREELSAAPDVGWPDCFNSGVFVFKPDLSTFEKLIQFAADKGSFDGGDQGLLNLFFAEWAASGSSSRLPFVYNMSSTACYSYLPAFKQFGHDAKIIHFIGSSKPWLQHFDSASRQVHPGQGEGHLTGLLQLWWDIFCDKVHPDLSPNMAGLAGAFAQITLGVSRSEAQTVFEETMRKQAWEAGHIDYLGRDSFDNIWAKISETLEQKSKLELLPVAEDKPQEEVKLDSPLIDTESVVKTTAASGGVDSGESQSLASDDATPQKEKIQETFITEWPKEGSESKSTDKKTSESAVSTDSTETPGVESAVASVPTVTKEVVTDNVETIETAPLAEPVLSAVEADIVAPLVASDEASAPVAAASVAVVTEVISAAVVVKSLSAPVVSEASSAPITAEAIPAPVEVIPEAVAAEALPTPAAVQTVSAPIATKAIQASIAVEAIPEPLAAETVSKPVAAEPVEIPVAVEPVPAAVVASEIILVPVDPETIPDPLGASPEITPATSVPEAAKAVPEVAPAEVIPTPAVSETTHLPEAAEAALEITAAELVPACVVAELIPIPVAVEAELSSVTVKSEAVSTSAEAIPDPLAAEPISIPVAAEALSAIVEPIKVEEKQADTKTKSVVPESENTVQVSHPKDSSIEDESMIKPPVEAASTKPATETTEQKQELALAAESAKFISLASKEPKVSTKVELPPPTSELSHPLVPKTPTITEATPPASPSVCPLSAVPAVADLKVVAQIPDTPPAGDKTESPPVIKVVRKVTKAKKEKKEAATETLVKVLDEPVLTVESETKSAASSELASPAPEEPKGATSTSKTDAPVPPPRKKEPKKVTKSTKPAPK